MKTEQRSKMKSKATERSFNESWKKFVIFNCGTSEKMWVTITILRSNLLIACIIPKREPKYLLRSSYKERKGNALASGADEGRDKLR